MLARYEVDPIKPAAAEEQLLAAIKTEASAVANKIVEEFNRKMTSADLTETFDIHVAKKQEYGTIYPMTTNPRVLEAALSIVQERLSQAGWKCAVALKRTKVAWFWSYVDYDRPTFVFRGDR